MGPSSQLDGHKGRPAKQKMGSFNPQSNSFPSIAGKEQNEVKGPDPDPDPDAAGRRHALVETESGEQTPANSLTEKVGSNGQCNSERPNCKRKHRCTSPRGDKRLGDTLLPRVGKKARTIANKGKRTRSDSPDRNPKRKKRGPQTRRKDSPKVESHNILYQNCNHCLANTEALRSLAIEKKAGIVFCTEPAVKKPSNNCYGLNGFPYCQRIHSMKGKPRAAIIKIDKSLDLVECPDLTTPDCAVALWNIDGGIICVSLYASNDSDKPMSNYITHLANIQNFAHRHNYEILINGDMNAETPQWGRRTEDIQYLSNRRGLQLEDLVLQKAWVIHNEPGTTTFKRGKNIQTCIDLTVSTAKLSLSLKEWRAEFTTNSDHAVLSVYVETSKKDPEEVLVTDTCAFNLDLAKGIWSPPNCWSAKILNDEAAALENKIRDTWKRHSRKKGNPNMTSNCSTWPTWTTPGGWQGTLRYQAKTDRSTSDSLKKRNEMNSRTA